VEKPDLSCCVKN